MLIDMMFLFSRDISFTRKLVYLGCMIVVASLLALSMESGYPGGSDFVVSLSIGGGVTGLSVISSVFVLREAIIKYSKLGFWVVAFSIPPFWLVLMCLGVMVFGSDDFFYYVVNGFSVIVFINLFVMGVVAFLFYKKSNH